MMRALFRSQEGNFGVFAAILVAPLMAVAAYAVDYVDLVRARTNLQNAADAAVLAAASSGKTLKRDLEDIVRKTIVANLDLGLVSTMTIREVEISEDGAIGLTVSAVQPSLFARALFRDGMDMTVSAAAVRPGDQTIEIALVLDTTGSMKGTKLSDLKSATYKLLDTFSAQKEAKIRVGLVPFSNYVNVGTGMRGKTWLDVEKDGSTSREICQKERPVTGKSGCRTVTTQWYNDGVRQTGRREVCSSYTYGPEETVCRTKTETVKWDGCVGSRPTPDDTEVAHLSVRYEGLMNTGCTTPISPLTANLATIRTAVGQMSASGATYIPAGALWGWNLLNPGEPFSGAAAFSQDTRKVMVIMTDGANTISPDYPTHNGRDAVLADKLMDKVCANARSAGVEIYTVAVGVDTMGARRALAQCASTQEAALEVSDSAALDMAFQAIAERIFRVRLTM